MDALGGEKPLRQASNPNASVSEELWENKPSKRIIRLTVGRPIPSSQIVEEDMLLSEEYRQLMEQNINPSESRNATQPDITGQSRQLGHTSRMPYLYKRSVES